MPSNKILRCAKGRQGYRFVFRDIGRRIRLSDYVPAELQNIQRGFGAHSEKRYDKSLSVKRKKDLEKALVDFQNGKYITAPIFVMLCNQHEVKLHCVVRAQCQYMNELDLSILTIRHKSTRGEFERNHFNGIFDSIQQLIAKTV